MTRLRESFTKLERHLIGCTPPVLKSARNGAILAAVAFFLFEWASQLNQNLPRIPVSWLLAALLPLIEGIVFLRLRSILKYPRSDDFLFVLRIRYDQRHSLASLAQDSSTRSFLAFATAAAAVAFAGEALIMRERSIITLFGVPVFLIAVVYGSGMLYRMLLGSAMLHPSRRDAVKTSGSIIGNSPWGRIRSQTVITGAALAGHFAPKRIRSLVKRDTIYLLRNEPLLLLLSVLLAPLLLVLLLLVIRGAPAGFEALFTLIGIIVINSIHGTVVQESADQLARCPYYAPRLKQVIGSTMYSSFLVSLPLTLTYAIFIFIKYPPLNAISLLFTFAAGLAMVLFYLGTLVTYPSRICGERVSDWLLCGLTGIGMFIPWVGWLFPAVIATAVALLEWKILTFKGTFAGYRLLNTPVIAEESKENNNAETVRE